MYNTLNFVVGIAGKAHVGKSTAARTFCEELELRPYTIAETVTRGVHACYGSLTKNFWRYLKIKRWGKFTV